ncbi:MAG TPA: alpha-L-fucosidase [Phycisphaerae bacterium]|nr:alpha-L-fucosidase [Phycisphaerae bacterium]
MELLRFLRPPARCRPCRRRWCRKSASICGICGQLPFLSHSGDALLDRDSHLGPSAPGIPCLPAGRPSHDRGDGFPKQDEREGLPVRVRLSATDGPSLVVTCLSGGLILFLHPKDPVQYTAPPCAPSLIVDSSGITIVRPSGRSAGGKARLDWFTQARFGLFIRYGLYSQLGAGEWVMYRKAIPVAEYVKLKDTFTADRFDADVIADMAVAAGMKYVNITAKHHDGFCLFRTRATGYNSVESPARRDLIGELAEACRRRKLGLFLYYSYAADWKHPYFMPRSEQCPIARPAYKKPETTYRFTRDEDFRIYVDYVHQQLRELLTQYGPVAGIWSDPIAGYYQRPDLYPIDETYALVRSVQPGCLISFKQGANGDEDFAAPEHKVTTHRITNEVAVRAWEKNRGKPIEICTTLQPKGWNYSRESDGEHRAPDDVMQMLADAEARNANLLLNTDPLPDGSIHPEDVATLYEVGRRLRTRDATVPAQTS